MVNRLKACTKEPSKFEKPRRIGERSKMREIKMTSVRVASEKPLNNIFETTGMRKKARPEMMIIRTEKKEKMSLIKLRNASGPRLSSSMMKGMRTESETTEAAATKIRSGIRKAA